MTMGNNIVITISISKRKILPRDVPLSSQSLDLYPFVPLCPVFTHVVNADQLSFARVEVIAVPFLPWEHRLFVA